MVFFCSHLDTLAHGAPARAHSIPLLTPEIAEQLGKESRAIRKEFHERIKRMWRISPAERLIISK